MESTATTESTPAAEAPISDVPAGMNPAYMKKDTKLPTNKEHEPEVPAETTEEKKEAAALKRKFKVRGKEIEVELDDGRYHDLAQKGWVAEEKWQEAAKMKKEADAFVERLKKNPIEVLKDPSLGVDFRKVAEDYLWEQMQEENLSPEEKQYRREQNELKDLRDAKQQYESEQEAIKHQAEVQHFEQDYDRKVSTALADSGLPKTTGTIRRITEYMLLDVKNGVERPIADYVDLVSRDYAADIKDLIGQLPADKLLKLLGGDVAKKIRDHDVAKLRSPQPASGHTFVPGKGMVKDNKPQKKLGGHDWQQQIMKEMRGL